MVNALLVLYITGKLHVDLKDAYAIYAAFGSLFFSSSLLGGFLGGRYDHKAAIMVGCLLAGIGGCFVAIHEIHFVFLGLACFIIGSGLTVPNLNCIIGKLFKKDDPLRDSGFTISYIGVNVGSVVAALASGFIAHSIGFSAAFIMAFALLIVLVIALFLNFHRLEFYTSPNVRPYKPEVSFSTVIPIAIISLIAVPAVTFLLDHAHISNILLISVGILMALLIVKLAMNEKGLARKKLFGFLIFITFGIAFWALYMLAPSALTIFVKNNVDRMIGSFQIPTASVYSLNPFFIITLGTLTSLLFLRMSRKGEVMPLRFKFATGIISMGLGYVILIFAIGTASSSGYVAFWWIVLSYFLQTLGELFIGPIGFSMVGSLVPVKLEGLMMGVWQLSTGVAGAISGYLASATATTNAKQAVHPLLTNPTFSHFFGLYGSIAVGVGIVILLLTPQFKKLWA
jgi:POT family proton-dependent oligopeptide transporter